MHRILFFKGRGIRAFWSHGGNRRAGVGILLNQKFLDEFKTQAPEWGEIAVGEAAMLQLQGEEGNLDIFSLYLPTGNAGSSEQERLSLLEQRNIIRSQISERVKRPEGTLNIMAGGVN